MPPSLRFDFDRYPYLTPNLAGIGGQIRQQNSDFQVTEIPAYPTSGEGEHLFVYLEKEGLTTRQLLERVRDTLGAKEKDIGVAGLKDKRALTRQWFSLPFKFEERLGALEGLEGIRVLETSRHSNKLKIGHLRGNQFRILLRQEGGRSGDKQGGRGAGEQGGKVKELGFFSPASQGVSPMLPSPKDDAPLHGEAAQASEIFRALAAKGVPNFFGPQRFGLGGQNAERGYDLVTGKRVHVLPWLKKFLVSSLQSLLFNDWVQLRLEQGTFHQVIEGDVAKKHDSGGEFVVEDAELENPRALRFEISATGPLYGKKYRESVGAARQIEDEILARYELTRQHFDRRFGDRRLIRFPLADWAVEEAPEGLWVSFFLPKGAYATAVLRELMKRNPEEGEGELEEPSEAEE